MDIISKLIQIDKPKSIDNEFIESKLKELEVTPLRWAIVNVSNDNLTISVAYENLC